MALKVSKVDVWACQVEDQPNALAQKLDILAEAGVDLGSVLARRRHEKPGKGQVFLSPIKGARQQNAAKKAGFTKAGDLFTLRVEAVNKPGLCAAITTALGTNGINLRGLTAMAMGKQACLYVTMDSDADAAKAKRLIAKLK